MHVPDYHASANRRRLIFGLLLLFLLCAPLGLAAQGHGSSFHLGSWLAERRGELEERVVQEGTAREGSVLAEGRPGRSVWTLLGTSALLGMVAALLPGRRKALLAIYVLAEDIELSKGIAAAVVVALLQAAVAVLIALTAQSVGTVSETIATIGSVLILLFGLTMTAFKVTDALNSRRHYREESILAKLKTVSDEIDPEHHDPARDMIFQHRRAGRRRRSRERAFLPVMILSAIVPAPAVAVIAVRAAEADSTLFAAAAILAATLGSTVVFAAVAAIAIGVKNGSLWLLRARTARIVQIIIELLAAVAMLVLGAVLVLSLLG